MEWMESNGQVVGCVGSYSVQIGLLGILLIFFLIKDGGKVISTCE